MSTTENKSDQHAVCTGVSASVEPTENNHASLHSPQQPIEQEDSSSELEILPECKLNR
jgi:hypothetical protein